MGCLNTGFREEFCSQGFCFGWKRKERSQHLNLGVGERWQEWQASICPVLGPKFYPRSFRKVAFWQVVKWLLMWGSLWTMQHKRQGSNEWGSQALSVPPSERKVMDRDCQWHQPSQSAIRHNWRETSYPPMPWNKWGVGSGQNWTKFCGPGLSVSVRETQLGTLRHLRSIL